MHIDQQLLAEGGGHLDHMTVDPCTWDPKIIVFELTLHILGCDVVERFPKLQT